MRRWSTVTAGAVAFIAVVGLVGCTAGEDPTPTEESSTPTITAPPPTQPASPTPTEPEIEFKDIDTSDWRTANAQDGRGSLKVPAGWGWNWEYQVPAGVPDGQYLDTVILTQDGKELLSLRDAQNPPPQCSGDGEAVLLDSAELEANADFTYVAIAVPSDNGVQFGAGVIETDRVTKDTCGVSFYITDDLPYMAATTAILPNDDLDDHWVFGSIDEVTDYMGDEEFGNIRASLLSFQPPA